MATRKLGGGRVLGSGRSLSPAVPPQHQRTSSLVSPSESSVSLTSQSTETQDLSSRVSLENGDHITAAAAAASSRLVCPICNEEMVTLLQLNRHIDDDHQNLEEIEQDEVKTWFKTQMVKAKRFQPLAVLNQKLKGLDVFESNDLPTSVPVVANGSPRVEPAKPDADEVVTRSHWQRSGMNDVCSEPTCGKGLGAVNGSVNCRKCGKLFCEEHTMYQMKLSRSAQHEPVRGFWCRCCETCYKSREGYNDHTGLERNHTDEFVKTRRKVVDKAYLEVSRLEKRLTKLTQSLAALPPDPGGGILSSLTGSKNQRKTVEQSVVTWEDDATVAKCPFCQQEFNNYTFRRHHCRICGRVVCNDPRTLCSSEIGLNAAATTNGVTEKTSDMVSLDIRMCRDCDHTLFSARDFAAALAKPTPSTRAYNNLIQFERGIRLTLPKFQRLLLTLQDPDKPPTPATIQEASKTRKRLIDSFAQYDVAARRIRDLPTKSPTQQKLQTAIYVQASSFLHLHMLPLKTLPKLLKHASPHGRPLPSPNGRPNGGALASIKYSSHDASSIASSSSAVSALEAEEKELRERLIVLEEQRFFVQEMIRDAGKRRRFDEVSSLAGHAEELSKEIDTVQGMLAGLDFQGAYAAAAGTSVGSPLGR